MRLHRNLLLSASLGILLLGCAPAGGQEDNERPPPTSERALSSCDGLAVLDQFTTPAAEVPGTTAEITITDQLLTVPGGCLQAGDWLEFTLHVDQNGRHAADRTTLKVYMAGATPSQLFSSGPIELPTGAAVPIVGRLYVTSSGPSAAARAYVSAPYAPSASAFALSLDTSRPLEIRAGVSHESNDPGNKTQLRAGSLRLFRRR